LHEHLDALINVRDLAQHVLQKESFTAFCLDVIQVEEQALLQILGLVLRWILRTLPFWLLPPRPIALEFVATARFLRLVVVCQLYYVVKVFKHLAVECADLVHILSPSAVWYRLLEVVGDEWSHDVV